METISIISASDDRYVQHLGVMLVSLFLNKSAETIINVFILDGGISDRNKSRIISIAKKYSFPVSFILINNEEYKDLKVAEYVTSAVYYRISIPDLIPADVKKILYLDCDIVVEKDLTELWNTDIDGYCVAAVQDLDQTLSKNLGLPTDSDYFNSGVLLINIGIWKGMDITKKAIDFARRYPGKIRFWDQDALNATIFGRWLHLPVTYNFSSSLLAAEKTAAEASSPHIIHYYGLHQKPWLFMSDCSKKNYYYYLLRSPWKFYIPVDLTYQNFKRKFAQKHPVSFSLLKKTKNRLKEMLSD